MFNSKTSNEKQQKQLLNTLIKFSKKGDKEKKIWKYFIYSNIILMVIIKKLKQKQQRKILKNNEINQIKEKYQ